MIHNEVKKFMALAPLMLPTLINGRRMESEITEDAAVLIFELDEPYPMGFVMEQLDGELGLRLLYHAIGDSSHHVCYFVTPRGGGLMYKVNFQTKQHDYVHSIIVTLYESLDVWEEEMELDIKAHLSDFDFVSRLDKDELLSTFCKMSYED